MSNGRPGRSEPAVIVGVVIVVLGVAFLLRNVGILRIDWDLLWPVAIIAVGAVVLFGALWGGGARASDATSVSIPSQGARRLELELRLGAGRYRLAAGASGLVDVASNGPAIEHWAEQRGDVTRVRLSPAIGWWGWTWRSGIDWRIAVAGGMPTTLDVQAGAGDFDLDLSGIEIASASIVIGASELRVVLPRPRGDVPIRVQAGAASVTFDVPPGVEARVTTAGLVSTSGRPETPGYASASDRVTVTVTGGAASVRVR